MVVLQRIYQAITDLEKFFGRAMKFTHVRAIRNSDLLAPYAPDCHRYSAPPTLSTLETVMYPLLQESVGCPTMLDKVFKAPAHWRRRRLQRRLKTLIFISKG